jgi:hypothetical protein
MTLSISKNATIGNTVVLMDFYADFNVMLSVIMLSAVVP